MNTTTFTQYTDAPQPNNAASPSGKYAPRDPHLVVQILSVIAFGVFSIVGVVLAFNAFWVAGLVLAIVIASLWSGTRTFSARTNTDQNIVNRAITDLAPTISKNRSTGNSSFDAYRTDMLERLEQENRDFENFLVRLRKANDAQEFDRFMDDRAAKENETLTVEKG